MNKKLMYLAEDSQGTFCYFEDLDSALEFLKAEVENFPEEDIEEQELELSLTVKFMTEEEVEALPEYNP